jgi:hypothetical protein
MTSSQQEISICLLLDPEGASTGTHQKHFRRDGLLPKFLQVLRWRLVHNFNILLFLTLVPQRLWEMDLCDLALISGILTNVMVLSVTHNCV